MENKKTFSPVVFDNVDPRIRDMMGSKQTEEKIYLILYTYRDRGEDEQNSFSITTGRIGCCEEIENILNSHDFVDIHNSVILVEIPVINSKGDGEWVMKHPDRAMTIYQFAKKMQVYFRDNFDIEDYNTENSEDDNDRDISNEEIAAHMRDNAKAVHTEAEIFEGSQEMADVYNQIMNDSQNHIKEN